MPTPRKRTTATALRRQAEEQAQQTPDDLVARSPVEIQRMVHELRVHQIELQQQNEELRTAQVALDAARARYFDLYDLAPVGYITLSDKGLIQEANLTAATLLGVTRGALVTQPFAHFILAADQSRYYLHRNAHWESGAPQAFELRLVHHDGTVFWAGLAMTAAPQAGGAPLCHVVLSGIAARKQAELAQHGAHALLDAVLNAIPVRVFWKDCNLRYLGCNMPFARDAGLEKPDDLIGQDDYAMGWRAQAEQYQADDRAVIASGQERLLYEEQQTTPTGAQISLLTSKLPLRDAGGAIIGVLGTYLDITARKQAEELACAEQALSSTVINSIPGAFYMLDQRGCYVRWNAVQRDDILGMPDDQIAGTPALATIHPDDRALIQARIANVLRHGVTEVVEGRVLLRGGPAFRWLLMTGRQLIVAGSPFLVGIGIDITERKQAEVALRDSERRQAELLVKLNEAQQLAAFGNWEWDVHTQHVWWSDETYRIFGVTPQNFVPTFETVAAFIHPEDTALYRAAFEHAAHTGAPLDVDLRLISKDGTLKYCHVKGICVVDEAGQPRRIIGTIMDITVRKQAEEQTNKQLDELRRWHAVTLGREDRIGALKREVNALAARLGEQQPYETPDK